MGKAGMSGEWALERRKLQAFAVWLLLLFRAAPSSVGEMIWTVAEPFQELQAPGESGKDWREGLGKALDHLVNKQGKRVKDFF